LGLKLAADQVFVLAHWITDRDLKRRFDVPFLVARMPEGQTPVADEQEQFEPVWIRPSEALRRHHEDDFFIIFPTIRTLERMQAHDSVDSVLQACANEQPWFTSCPRAGFLNAQEVRFMEHDAPYGELALTCRDGQIVHHLDWQTQTPVRLLQHVQRLTAPNPSIMTGPGTNSYLVGDSQSGFIVIDPGPPDDAHVQRLWDKLYVGSAYYGRRGIAMQCISAIDNCLWSIRSQAAGQSLSRLLGGRRRESITAYASTLFHLDEAGTGVVPQADFLRTRGWFEYLAEDVEPW
jgi:hypothetical protein